MFDLIGLYITDDYVQVIIGADSSPNDRKIAISDLELAKWPSEGEVEESFAFDDHSSVQDAFTEAISWALKHTTNPRAIGVGCYGPFRSLTPSDKRYGVLQKTSHGRMSEKSIPVLLENALTKCKSKPLPIYVETDVAVAAIGETYRRSFSTDGKRRKSIDDQVIVYVKASLGIGGAFLRARSPWRGRIHPEMGQISVPRWIDYVLDPGHVEAGFHYRWAENPNSIEGLASVGAIEQRFGVSFSDLILMKEHPLLDAVRARQAWYLSQMAWAVTCVVSPHTIMFGGRILRIPGMLAAIQATFTKEFASKPFPYYPEMQRSDFISVCASRDRKNVVQPGIVGALCFAAMQAQPASARLTDFPARPTRTHLDVKS